MCASDRKMPKRQSLTSQIHTHIPIASTSSADIPIARKLVGLLKIELRQPGPLKWPPPRRVGGKEDTAQRACLASFFFTAPMLDRQRKEAQTHEPSRTTGTSRQAYTHFLHIACLHGIVFPRCSHWPQKKSGTAQKKQESHMQYQPYQRHGQAQVQQQSRTRRPRVRGPKKPQSFLHSTGSNSAHDTTILRITNSS